MLQHLYIENYALIQRLEINFQSGFSVITGETGAGKSILLGALGLILGERADVSALLDKNTKCIVEGRFDLEKEVFLPFFQENDLDFESQSLLRREVNPAGKSRAFINDTPVNLNVLKALGSQLVDIHSQHENLLLKEAGFQMAVIDHYADNQPFLKHYHTEYQHLQKLKNSFEKLAEQEKQSRIDEDYYRFQVNELVQARLESGETSRLESDNELFSHSEEIKDALNRAIRIFHHTEPSLLDQLSEAKDVLEDFSGFTPELQEIVQRLQSGFIELKDIGSDLERLESHIHYDPESLENIRQRLDVLYSLQKKHRLTHPDELIMLRDELEQKLESIENLNDSIAVLQQEIVQQETKVDLLAEELHLRRKNIISDFSERITGILRRLGIPDARFHAMIEKLDQAGHSGKDRVQFLFNANKGGETGEISKIASGGELSRIMLTLKSVVAEKLVLPTVIFDEIDMGVSGKTADMVGSILQEMSSGKQLIVITHLPQIAAKGTSHLFVYKETGTSFTHSTIRILNPNERVEEIARLISGESITKAALTTAHELLANNSQF